MYLNLKYVYTMNLIKKKNHLLSSVKNILIIELI